jgi:hypothetical protein
MTQLCLVCTTLLDLMWVLRLNLVVGIPDKAFAVGDEAASYIAKYERCAV